MEQARVAVYAVFTLAGVLFASFASRIPQVKSTLDLTPGELGLTLLGGTVGSVVGLPLAGWIAHRIGAGRAVLAGATATTLGLTAAAAGVDLVHSRWVVMAALFVAMVGVGVWDVSMNLEGADVERLLGRTIMPRFHAAFSAGTVGAALVGTAVTARGIPVLVHIAVVSAASLVVTAWMTGRFLPRVPQDSTQDDAGEGPAGAGMAQAWRERRTLLVGVVVLVAAFTEGSANDWLAVALVDGYRLPEWVGVLGFAIFLSAMTAGRLAGTHWLDRYGRVPVLRVLFVLAVVGSLLVVWGGPWLAFVGIVIWGVGASLGFPVGMSAAADDPARAPARVSVVSTIGYGAFLIGPPLLGFLGDHVGVLRALMLVGLLALLALAVVPATRPVDAG
ncbi:MAG TPA: MFS transporter [Dermatophilaceae bacterium]|nr:MFS transporter [Dermatophilaceae bacterium]